jgi:hypothetical protein
MRRDFLGAEQKLAIGAVDDEAPPGLAAFEHGRNGTTVGLCIQQDRLAGRIILVVRRLLEKPPQHAGPGIEGATPLP